MLNANVVGIIASILFFSGLILVLRAISNLRSAGWVISGAELKRVKEELSRSHGEIEAGKRLAEKMTGEAESALLNEKKEIEETRAELDRLRVELDNRIEKIKAREEEARRLNEQLERTRSEYKEFEAIDERISKILDKWEER